MHNLLKFFSLIPFFLPGPKTPAERIARVILDTPIDRPPQTFVEELANVLWDTPLQDTLISDSAIMDQLLTHDQSLQVSGSHDHTRIW